MNSFCRLFILIFFILLSGCAGTVKIINEETNPYHFQPNMAVVVVGTIGSARLITLKALQKKGIQIFELAGKPSKKIDAFAWKIQVGDSFQLTNIEMGYPHQPKLVKTFTTSHIVKIDQEGIYYYGTLLSKERNIVLIRKPLPDLISLANQKYPYTFNILKPVNFK